MIRRLHLITGLILFGYLLNHALVLGVEQAAVLLVAWLHACVGLHFWRDRIWAKRRGPAILPP